MSFGSVSIVAMLSRVRAAAALGTFCCTGEGGYPDELKPYDDHVITQVATGLFGVREETIKRVAHRGVQVRPGGEARSRRTPPRRQGNAQGRRHERGRAGERPLLPLPLPQRLLGRGPQEARGLDQGDQPQRPGERQGLDAHRRGYGCRGELLRGRPHHPARRELRRDRARPPTSRRRISPCPSNTPSRRYTSS